MSSLIFSENNEKVFINVAVVIGTLRVKTLQSGILLSTSPACRLYGWMTCHFTSFSTVFQLHQDDERVIIKDCVQWNSCFQWVLNPGPL